jgi:hypothetical protein
MLRLRQPRAGARVEPFFEQVEQVRRTTNNINNIQLAHISNVFIPTCSLAQLLALREVEQVGVM